MTMNAAVLAIVLNIVAVFIVYIFRVARYFIFDRRGPLAGEWIARHLSEGEVVKVDLVICYHRGERVRGSVNRIAPYSEAKKVWDFTGNFREGRLVGYYGPRRGQTQTGSFGVFIMKKGGPLLEGHYFQSKTNFVNRQDGVAAFDEDGHERFRLRWQRLHQGRTPIWARTAWAFGVKTPRRRYAAKDEIATTGALMGTVR